jgi:hypothetical protein
MVSISVVRGCRKFSFVLPVYRKFSLIRMKKRKFSVLRRLDPRM